MVQDLKNISNPRKTLHSWESIFPTPIKSLSFIHTSTLSKLLDLSKLQIALEAFETLDYEQLIDAPSFFVKDLSYILSALMKTINYNRNYVSHKLKTAEDFLASQSEVYENVEAQIKNNRVYIDSLNHFQFKFLTKSLEILSENVQIFPRDLAISVLSQIPLNNNDKHLVVLALLPHISSVKSHLDIIGDILISTGSGTLPLINEEIAKFENQPFSLRDCQKLAVLKYVKCKLSDDKPYNIFENTEHILDILAGQTVSITNKVVAEEILFSKLKLLDPSLSPRIDLVKKLASLADAHSPTYKYILSDNHHPLNGEAEVIPDAEDIEESNFALALWHLAINILTSSLVATPSDSLKTTIYEVYDSLLMYCFHPMLADAGNKIILTILSENKLDIPLSYALSKIGDHQIYPGRRCLPLVCFFRTFLQLYGRPEEVFDKLIEIPLDDETTIIHYLNILKLLCDKFDVGISRLVVAFNIFSEHSSSGIWTISSVCNLGRTTISKKFLEKFAADKIRFCDLPFAHFDVYDLYLKTLDNGNFSGMLIMLNHIEKHLAQSKNIRESKSVDFLIKKVVTLAMTSNSGMIRSLCASILVLVLSEEKLLNLMSFHQRLNHRHFCYNLASKSNSKAVKTRGKNIALKHQFYLLDETASLI